MPEKTGEDTNHGSLVISCEIDACGLACPLPILKTKKALMTLSSGEVLRVFSSDPSAKHDFIAYTSKTGHTLLEISQLAPDRWLFLIMRK